MRNILRSKMRARRVISTVVIATMSCTVGASTVIGASVASASTTTTTVPASATKALLTLKDMPSGWTSSKSSNDNSTPLALATPLSACTGIPVSVLTANPPTANSPTFTSGDSLLSVDDSVEVFPTAKAAQTDIATVTNKKLVACYAKVVNGAGKSAITQGIPAGATVGKITVAHANNSIFASPGDNLVIDFPMTVKKQTLNFQVIEVGYVKGNVEQQVTFTSIDETFKQSFYASITKTVVKRLS